MKTALGNRLMEFAIFCRRMLHSPLHLLVICEKQRLLRLCRKHRAIILTYDDGPGAYLTSTILEVLDENNVKASFFPLGMRVAQNSNTLDLVKSAGHEIGFHGLEHLNAWKTSAVDAIADILDGQALLACWMSPNRLFRPPHGKITIRTCVELFKRKIRPIWWTHDSHDTRRGQLPEVDDFVNSVIQAGGGVVLLHDFDRDGGNPTHPRNEYVIDVTRQLIMKSRYGKFRLMTIGDLLYSRK